MKIINGGVYLVDAKGNRNPEFGNAKNQKKHYYILIKAASKDLYLGFPITTSENRANDKAVIPNPIKNSKGYILLHQVRPISKHRVLDVQNISGEPVVLSLDELRFLINEYQKYIELRLKSTEMAINDYHKRKEISRASLSLHCNKHTIIPLDELAKALDSILISYNHIDDSVIPYLCSPLPSKVGEYTRTVYIKDSFEQKLSKKVTISIVEKNEQLES